MDRPESILLYTDILPDVESMDLEARGILLTNVLHYGSGQEPPLEMTDAVCKLLFLQIARKIDRNARRYAEIKKQRKGQGQNGTESQHVSNQ